MRMTSLERGRRTQPLRTQSLLPARELAEHRLPSFFGAIKRSERLAARAFVSAICNLVHGVSAYRAWQDPLERYCLRRQSLSPTALNASLGLAALALIRCDLVAAGNREADAEQACELTP